MKSDFDLNQQNENTESRIAAALERIANAFKVLLWNESKELELTPIQVQILIFLLYHHESLCTVSSLSAEFGMTKATVSEVVKTLERKKLIEKEQDESDTRSFILRLTREGKSTAKQAALFSSALHSPIKAINRQEKEIMLNGLLHIIYHLHSEGIITVQRMCYNCRFYESKEKGSKHYCRLLKKHLSVSALRLDCPEFEPAETA